MKATILGAKTSNVFPISFDTSNAIKIPLPKKSMRPNNWVMFKHSQNTAHAAIWFAATVSVGTVTMNITVKM